MKGRKGDKTMTLARFLNLMTYGGTRPQEISVARWNGMMKFYNTHYRGV
jgi:hypothetical protein